MAQGTFENPAGIPMWIDYVTNYMMIMEDVPQPLPVEEKAPEDEIDWTEMDY